MCGFISIFGPPESNAIRDVLTGLLAALLAQGLDPLDAARLGVYLHGLAGDLAAVSDRGTEPGLERLIASDLIDLLPLAMRRLSEEGEESTE